MVPFLIASLLASPWISLLLHEGAHVAAAWMTGLQLREIRLGRGPTVYRTVLFGAETQVGHAVPDDR